MVKDELFGKDVKLSYSRLELMKCPLKYYITKFIGVKSVSVYIVVGLVVHKIYEEILTGRISDEDGRSEELIRQYVTDILNIYGNEIMGNSSIDDVVKEIKQHIWNDLVIYVDSLVKRGYELMVESEHMISSVSILNTEGIYIRPDIYLINKSEGKLKLLDIKTSKRYKSDYRNQLVFYLKLLSDEHTEIQYFDGLIYLSRYGELKKVITSYTKEKIDVEFDKLLKPIIQLYTKLGISDFKTIKKFVKKVNLLNEKELFELRCELFSSVGNVCNYCPIKNICPIYTLKPSIDFSNLIKGETKEDLIIVTSAFEPIQTELVGFVEK